MKQYKLDNLNEEYRLNIGDRLVLEDSLFAGFDIVYAGKPSNNKFSLVCTQYEFMLRRMQGNLFFPDNLKKLRLHHKELEVLTEDSDFILLKYIG